ncbi:hypothetical protein LJC58_04415 [Lachnospiraceae bacterium OttesenSCG-928-D06]|nr:hypothetical protein [Lachnospiraceae bacterium OttesenSCG-928-D06]
MDDKRSFTSPNQKNILPKPYTIIYTILIFIGFLLTVGRWYSVFNPDFVLFNAEIHSHISNLSLSMIFYLGLGYSWLQNGVKFRLICGLGVFVVLANVICETLMGFMNTADIMDAVYGAVGTAMAFVFLLFAMHKTV